MKSISICHHYCIDSNGNTMIAGQGWGYHFDLIIKDGEQLTSFLDEIISRMGNVNPKSIFTEIKVSGEWTKVTTKNKTGKVINERLRLYAHEFEFKDIDGNVCSSHKTQMV